ncbi:MAG: DUF72 domain-containing protein [Ignavibacteriaceae bacterium]
MPIAGIYNNYKEYITDQTFIRLHGPDRSGIEKLSGENWNKIFSSRDEELKDIVEMIKDLLTKGVDVYLDVNNHYKGCTPMTIAKVVKLIPGV